jgi:hypothetical protein
MSDMSLVSGCVAYVGYVPCVRFVWLCPLCTGCLICGLCPICHCCTVPALWYRCVRICHDPGAVPGSCTGLYRGRRGCPGMSCFDAYVPCRQRGARKSRGPGALGYMGVEIVPGNGRYPPGPEGAPGLGAAVLRADWSAVNAATPPLFWGAVVRMWFRYLRGWARPGQGPHVFAAQGLCGGCGGRRAQVTER